MRDGSVCQHLPDRLGVCVDSWPVAVEGNQADRRRDRYFPGHLHAFYLEYIYYDRREQTKNGMPPHVRAPGVYSDRVQSGGYGYGTIVQPTGTHQGGYN